MRVREPGRWRAMAAVPRGSGRVFPENKKNETKMSPSFFGAAHRRQSASRVPRRRCLPPMGVLVAPPHPWPVRCEGGIRLPPPLARSTSDKPAASQPAPLPSPGRGPSSMGEREMGRRIPSLFLRLVSPLSSALLCSPLASRDNSRQMHLLMAPWQASFCSLRSSERAFCGPTGCREFPEVVLFSRVGSRKLRRVTHTEESGAVDAPHQLKGARERLALTWMVLDIKHKSDLLEPRRTHFQ